MRTSIKNIYDTIIELSDLSLQRKRWLNENNNTNSISSYAELMCRLFDDNGFDEFIDHSALENGISPELVVELNSLRESLNNYKEKESDREIIDDPKWEKIAEQAKKIMKKWRR